MFECHLEARAALEGLTLSHSVSIELERMPRPRNYQRSPIRFRFALGEFKGDYSAGIGCAESWARELLAKGERIPGLARTTDLGAVLARANAWNRQGVSLHDAEYLARIHGAYMPSTVDVLAALLMDAASVQDCEDWIEWAEEMGALGESRNGAEELRTLRESYHTCHKAARALRRAFGSDYPKALEAAQSL